LIDFVFGIHNHQPVGNFDFVIEDAYRKCYLPFVETLAKFPDIKVTLHNTGILWDWLEHNHPEYIEYIDNLLKAGQLELLSGGFYEPILPVIFDSHKSGQINQLTNYIKDKFDVVPRGMWLAERVWEPHLTAIFADCGIEYTILDDTHFRWAGLTEEQLDCYFITEEQHRKLALFPISKLLRYYVPFKTVDKVIEALDQMSEDHDGKLAIYADDGEKFGSWPDTYKLCYEEGWLANFFESISNNSSWLKMKFFSEALDQHPANGRIYLPTASYAEMGQWSLPSKGFVQYEELEKKLINDYVWESHGHLVRGGFWRNFLSKYPESNNMHKKMYRVAAKIESIKKPASAIKEKLDEATDLLYQGQCNCPYWHGVFGGLYLNHLRYATYNRFLRAEAIVDKLGALPEGGMIDIVDFDDDGQDELLIETDKLNAYFSPRYGGSMFELDLKHKGYNLLDTISRREEGYHRKLTQVKNQGENAGQSIHDRIEAKEKDLDKYLIYDWHRRGSFVDHIMPHQADLENFIRNKYQELGDFILEPFEFKTQNTPSKLTASFKRNGHLYHPRGIYDLSLAKAISVNKTDPIIEASYRLENRSKAELSFVLGIEFNWAMLAGDAPDRYYYIDGQMLENSRCNSRGESGNVKKFGLIDEHHKLDINVELSTACRLWRYPIETVSLSEYGFERVYQSSLTCLCFDIKLTPGESRKLKITLAFRDR
jgi:alpha-amylase